MANQRRPLKKSVEVNTINGLLHEMDNPVVQKAERMIQIRYEIIEISYQALGVCKQTPDTAPDDINGLWMPT